MHHTVIVAVLDIVILLLSFVYYLSYLGCNGNKQYKQKLDGLLKTSLKSMSVREMIMDAIDETIDDLSLDERVL